MIDSKTCILLVITLSVWNVSGLPDSTQKDETPQKQVNTGHSTVHDTYRAILRQLEALSELFKKLVSKESPTSGMSSNNTNMEHEYKATTAELASTTEVTAGNSDNQLNQLTHRTTLGSERQAVLSRVDDDGSGDESLLDVFEAKTEETLQESNVSKENIDEILAEDEVFNAMKKSQNSKSEVSTLKPSETDVSKSAKSHREGTSGMKYVEKEEPGKITTQPTEDHKMIPTSEKYVLEEIKEDEYTSTEKVTEQKFMNKFEDDGESLTPNVEDLIKRYKGTDEYTEGTSTEPMERSYEGTDPPFDTSDLMSQAIDEDTVGYTNTDPTTKTTINEYLRLLLHAIRPTKIPRKVKEEIFLPRGCTRPGLHLAYPYSKCMYLRCEFAMADPGNGRSVELAPDQLRPQTYLCEEGSAVPPWFFSGLTNPCLMKDPFCQ